ncbi:MAG TPA: hypothetical protein PKM72_05685, partial [Nitrospirales bacterium]|nr:hypothetical protein [Nitrospirales bacterium]
MKIREATIAEAQHSLAAPSRISWRIAAGLRRALLTVLVLIQSFVAASYMTAILPYHGGNFL